jgi:hypothetical protein
MGSCLFFNHVFGNLDVNYNESNTSFNLGTLANSAVGVVWINVLECRVSYCTLTIILADLVLHNAQFIAKSILQLDFGSIILFFLDSTALLCHFTEIAQPSMQFHAGVHGKPSQNVLCLIKKLLRSHAKSSLTFCDYGSCIL